MEEIIKEIAQTLDVGEKVYLNRTTNEILSFPVTDDGEFDYLADEVMEEVDADPENFIEFEPPTSRESFLIMEKFAESQEDEAIKRHLIHALQVNRPFRNFRIALEIQGLEQHFFAFKQAYLELQVRDKL